MNQLTREIVEHFRRHGRASAADLIQATGRHRVRIKESIDWLYINGLLLNGGWDESGKGLYRWNSKPDEVVSLIVDHIKAHGPATETELKQALGLGLCQLRGALKLMELFGQVEVEKEKVYRNSRTRKLFSLSRKAVA